MLPPAVARAAPRRPGGADPRRGRTGARRASRAGWPGPAGCGRHQRRRASTAAPFGCRRSGATAPARRRRRGTRPAGGTTPPSPRGGDRIGCAATGSTSSSAAGSRSAAPCRRCAGRRPRPAKVRPPATPRPLGRGLCPPSVRRIQAARRGRCPDALVGSPGNRPPSAGGRREAGPTRSSPSSTTPPRWTSSRDHRLSGPRNQRTPLPVGLDEREEE